MPGIHQLVAGFAGGDAISNEARLFQKMFTGWGFQSDIYCETRRVLPELRKHAIDLQHCLSNLQPQDILLLHLSMGSEVNEVFRRANCRKVLLYHNITPSSFFTLVNPTTAALLDRGMTQAASLAGVARLNLADSEFNASEMRSMGYRDVRVFPLALDLQEHRRAPDRSVTSRFNDGKVNILFVGRCVPNKKIEDLITAFAYFQKYLEPQSRLLHVGSCAGAERYKHLLMARVRELDLKNVVFTGAVDQNALDTLYSISHVFLCMSEHEGFCIPLLEAMHAGIPVLAYSAAAIPETLDTAGILFTEKNYPLISETIRRVVSDTELRQAVISRQFERIARFRARKPDTELRTLLEPLLS